jgi:Kdo2-lipid IVA lauroyltransferase/acyltransferase
MNRLFSHLGVAFMWGLARLPLAWVRGLGWVLGKLLHAAVRSRRRVAAVNLGLMHAAHLTPATDREIQQQVASIFTAFAQAWLDRSWLWQAAPSVLAKRLKVTGSAEGLALLRGNTPLVIFAPHFVGLDAGWVALTCPRVLGSTKPFATIYTDQSNKVVDAWILQGRRRFAADSVHGRAAGVQPIIGTLKNGGALYLLPDMDFGAEGAVFAPLFGKPAATVTSLSRFARLGRAQVLSVTSRLVDSGYEIEVSAPWTDYPTTSLSADTERMNRELESLIARNPTQYWWLHKRYKTRPAGEAELY